MPNNETLILGILVWLLIWFILGFFTGVIVKSKTEIELEKILWVIFFIIWVIMHIYWFVKQMDIPMMFDIVGAGSAGAMLWLKTSEKFTEAILTKLWKRK